MYCPVPLAQIPDYGRQYQIHISPDPGIRGTLSGSFIFTLTMTFPFEPFETLMMTCDRLKIVLERNKETVKYFTTFDCFDL